MDEALPVKRDSCQDALEFTIASHGGGVPNFNIEGRHHHRIPYKDKSAFLVVRANPEWTREPRSEPVFTNTAQRRKASMQESRDRAGLDTVSQPVNPDRERQELSLRYVADPTVATVTELAASRKAKMRAEAAETRLMGEPLHIPQDERHGMREYAEHQFRRPVGGDTLTQLKNRRRQAKVEYDMSNFGVPLKEHPRYSEQSEPWWTLQPTYVSEPQCALDVMAQRELTQKVTAIVHEFRRADGSDTSFESKVRTVAPDVRPSVARDKLGSKTVARWSSMFVPESLQSASFRLFDGLREAPVNSTDAAPLRNFSSFKTVKEKGDKEDRERQLKSSRAEQARTRAGRAIALEEMPSERRKASGRDTNVTATPVTRGIVSSFDMAQRKTCTSMPSERGAEDFSMTERLSRSATVRRQEAPVADGPRLRTQISKESLRRTVGSVPPPTSGTDNPQMTVRSSGFQWIDHTLREQRLLCDDSRHTFSNAASLQIFR